MPDGIIPMVVTSGLGVGVVAGVVSGICYVFIQGFRSTGSRRGKYAVTNPWQCCICGAHFTFRPPLPVATAPTAECPKFAVCAGCDGHACRDTCGSWVRSVWLCKQCEVNVREQKRGSFQTGWFKSVLTAFQPNAVTVRMSKPQGNTPSVTNLSGDNDPTGQPVHKDAAPEGDKEVVRDFIERLVGAMLGADLDDTSIGRIYADAEYDAMFARYHGDISSALTDLGSALHMSIANLPIRGQTPCSAHASLKNIIRRVLRDASNMAILKNPQNENNSPETTTNRTYEDLLATAILNKVIDNYQTDLRRSSSESASSRRSDSSHKRHKRDDARWRQVTNPDADTTSVSSVEEWCRSESSGGEKYVDHMSFTIQQSIEEITTSDEDNPSNQYLHSHNLTRNSLRSNDPEKDKNFLREDWQDNWLFSRKGKGSPKPVPVPMLVPNPSTDYRALIGDKDAEDTSDLSETGSDLDENDSLQDIKTLLVDSRTVIGGKNLLENVNTEYLEKEKVNDKGKNNENATEATVTDVREDNTGNGDTGFEDDDVSEAKNNILIHENSYVESDSLGSNTEKDMEYTEKYASFPRQISKDKSPIPSPRKSKETENSEEIIEIVNNVEDDLSTSDAEESEEEVDDKEPPEHLRGSYSEKEKQKWRNPVAIANNPYSKENIDRRLHEKTNTNDNYAYGRDYYIREAKKAAGGRKKFLDDDSNTEFSKNLNYFKNSGYDLEESLPVISENELPKKDQTIFKAVPAIVNTDDDKLEEKENLQSIPVSRPVSLALSTDSEDVEVKRVYNLETGKIFTYKNDFTKEIIQNSKSPEGTKFIVKPNCLVSSNLPDEVDSKFDENHNNQKEPIMSISNHISALTSPEPKITKQQFLLQQISVELDPEFNLINDEPQVLISPELKESSKKYLQSLAKNNNTKPTSEVMNHFSTPPISLQEYDTENSCELDTEDKIEVNLDNEIRKEDIQSCIDLRLINEIQQTTSEDNLLSPMIQTNGFAISTPNLTDDSLYYSEGEDKNNYKKSITSELDELTISKPSVKDLKKLFDHEKHVKITVSRSKSHLTTKPELKSRQIHSLTARSLSKEFRRDLQKNNEITNENSIEINEVAEEKNSDLVTEEVDELKTIPPCKTKIEYFECLKNKNV